MIEKHTRWLASALPTLRAIQRRTDRQRAVVEYADKPDRTLKDEVNLSALIRAEMAAEYAAKTAKFAARKLRTGSAEARKARNHRLIQLGALFELAGLDQNDRGELLGGLLGMAEVKDDEIRAKAKRRGDAVLAEREAKARDARAVQAATDNLESEAASTSLEEAQPA